MNPPCCKAESNKWAELLPTSWLPLALSSHISYIITSIHCWQPLSPVCVCVGVQCNWVKPLDIQGGLFAHRGPSYYKDQAAELRSCYLLLSAMSLSCCWISSPVSPLLLLQKQLQHSPLCLSHHDTIHLILLSIVSLINVLVCDKLLNRGKTESCLWIIWIPNRNSREEKKKRAGVQTNQLLSLDTRTRFRG